MSSRASLAILLAACTVASPVLAQPTPAAERVNAAEISVRVAQLEDELARASAELESVRAEWLAEETELSSRLESRSTELLDRALANARSHEELATLSARHLALGAEALETAIRNAISTSRSLAEQVSIQTAETPGFEAEVDETAATVEALTSALSREGSDRVLDPTTESRLVELAATLDRLHATGTTVTVDERTVLTARDVPEPVELLSAGAIGFAYRTREDRRVGWSLASPADASGYRWTEDLDQRTRETLDRAFDAVARGDSTIPVVVDASGTLRADAFARRRSLWTIVRDGGPVMVPIALVAALALLIICERLWLLARESVPGKGVLARVIGALEGGRHEEAISTLSTERGCVARVLDAGLRAIPRGTPAVEESLEARLLVELPRLDRGMSFLGMLGGVAPLLGLLGTVTGIIQTFTSIKVFRSTDPALLAGGISEALVTTAAGLIVAIPTVVAHGYLGGRFDRLLAESEKHAAILLEALTPGPAPTRESEDEA